MKEPFEAPETIEQEIPQKYLPSTIHAIWAGGSKQVPSDGMNNLVKWAYTNPGFKITLWIDDKVVPPDTDIPALREKYYQQFKEAYLKLANEEVDEVEINIESILDIKSIREEGICAPENDQVDYAIDRLDPNYGLSSDLLRYRILHKYGGVYVDLTDVTPGKEQTMDILRRAPYAQFGEVNNNHKLYIDHLSQAQNPSIQELGNFNLQPQSFSQLGEESERFLANSRVGNDSFICTKGNPLMLQLIQETERRLRCGTPNEKIMMAYGGFNVKDLTLDLSGPNVVKTVILDKDRGKFFKNQEVTTPHFMKSISPSSPEMSYLFPLKNNQYQIVKPPGNVRNTRYWNNVGVDLSQTSSFEEDIYKILAVANYEIQNMGVLRLEDHLHLLTQVARMRDIPPQDIPGACENFLNKLKTLPLEKVEVAQQISSNPLVTQFYQETGLSGKTCLGLSHQHLPSLLKIWDQSTSYGLFMGTQDYQPETLQTLNTVQIESTLKPLEICDVFQRIARGTQFMSHVKENAQAYPGFQYLLQENPQFQNLYLKDVTSKYLNILDAYFEAFINNGVSPQEINMLGRELIALNSQIGNPLPQKLDGLLSHYKTPDINLAFRRAAHAGHLEDVKYLAKYADINEQGGASRKTALHWAYEKDHNPVIDFLLNYGADPELKDSNMKTAAELAPNSNSLM